MATPPRTTLLRGAQVVTMAPGREDDERVDILIDGDRIVELGEHLDDGQADVVDLTGRIVIPGLINAHLHTWQTAMRFAGADWSLPEYLAHAHGEIAHHYRPDDIQVGTLSGALSQIASGVTTIGDWSHNCVSSEHADAAIDGLNRAGIRAVFLHGTPHGLRDRAHDVGEIDRLLAGPIAESDLVSLGMAVKGPQLSKSDVALADLRAAAERGVLASMHQSAGAPGPGWQDVGVAGLWGPLTNIVHGTGLTGAWIARLIDAGVTFTSTPENELGQGHATSLIQGLLRAGGAPSLGTDTEAVSSGELLIAARIAMALQRGLVHDEAHARTGLGATTLPITVKQALSWATVEGARALGLADRIGHLAPGMQADLTVVDARALNLWPLHQPVAAALNAGIANIEAVMVAGNWRKRDHVLLESDLDVVKERLHDSGHRLINLVRAPTFFGRARARVVARAVDRNLRKQADAGR